MRILFRFDAPGQASFMHAEFFSRAAYSEIVKNGVHTELFAGPSDCEGARHIVFGVNGHFVRYAFITIQSIIEQQADLALRFHIITDDDLSPLKETAAHVVREPCHSLVVHRLTDDLFLQLPTSSLFSKAIYYRLLAPHILADADELLYLDADIICLKPFHSLWSLSKNHCLPAFVALEAAEKRRALADRIGLNSDNYFNSGVMLINVREWLKKRVSLKVIILLMRKGQHFSYPDQDALNTVLHEKFGVLESRYNTIFMPGHSDAEYCRMPPPETVFLHFAGADKPWQQWNEQAACQRFKQIYRRSVWATQPFTRPEKDWQAKRMYKLMFRQRKFFAGLKWYLTYYRFRYLK